VRKGIRLKHLKSNLTAYAFLLPSFIGFILFIAVPVVMSLFLSFTEWDLVSGLKGIKFIGLDNFKNLWSDEWFIASLKNNLIYTGFYVPVSLIAGLMFALLLNSNIFGRSALRTMFFMPYISNVVAVSIVWMAIFHPTKGPLNLFLQNIGVENPPRWLASPDWALFAIIVIGVWINMGYNMVIYLAGLQNVPKEIEEAAIVDGANAWVRLIKIKLPILTPTTFFLTITGFMNSFKVFAPVNLITKGGPGMSTTVLVYYLYIQAFNFLNIGYSSAIAWILFAIVFIITLIQWRGQKKWVNYM
jgi:multiple sugar transport system permease protein